MLKIKSLYYLIKLKGVARGLLLILDFRNFRKKLPEYKNSLDCQSKYPITVFTSIIGGKDILLDDQITESANFIAFTDQKSKVWKTLKPYDKFKNDRMNARIHKIMPHMFFDTEYSIWMDGNFKIKVPAKEIVSHFLQEKDIAIWEHPGRNCIYDEAEACYKQNKETAEALGEQIKEYRKRGIPSQNGLYATGIIIRRHTKKINELNEKWWAECSRFSKRDQLSFAVTFPSEEINKITEGNIWKNKYFEIAAEHNTQV